MQDADHLGQIFANRQAPDPLVLNYQGVTWNYDSIVFVRMSSLIGKDPTT